MRIVGTLAGLFLIALMLFEGFETILLPRLLRSSVRAEAWAAVMMPSGASHVACPPFAAGQLHIAPPRANYFGAATSGFGCSSASTIAM